MENEEIINELLEKLKQCDDYHNRCDFLMEHDEITYMLDYITNLQKENEKLKERINLYKSVINDMKHILNNQIDYREFVDIVNAIEENARKSEL